MSRFDGKRALMTGAGSGIGAATARALRDEGADVLPANVDGEAAGALAAELGSGTLATLLDVRDEEQVRAAIVGAAAAGGLDVLVNAAGIGSTTTVAQPWVRRLVEEKGESLDALRARQPLGRLGTPEEIAAAIMYLASDAAAFVTGTLLGVDGGLGRHR